MPIIIGGVTHAIYPDDIGTYPEPKYKVGHRLPAIRGEQPCTIVGVKLDITYKSVATTPETENHRILTIMDATWEYRIVHKLIEGYEKYTHWVSNLGWLSEAEIDKCMEARS